MISFMVSRWVIYKFKIFIRMYSFKIRKFHTIYWVGKVWQLSGHYDTQCQNKKVYNEISDQLRYWYKGGDNWQEIGNGGLGMEIGKHWQLHLCVNCGMCQHRGSVVNKSTQCHTSTEDRKYVKLRSKSSCQQVHTMSHLNWK